MAQLGLGTAQPLVGRLAEHVGAARVIRVGAWALALSTAAIAWAGSVPLLALALTAAALAGSATGSNALLVGEIGRRLSPAQQGLAVGIVGAGGSAGQLLLSPATQWGIDHHGWLAALLATAALSLLALPLARVFDRPTPSPAAGVQAAPPIADVLRRPLFWAITGAFGMCGFHIGFLTMHMPGVIERCGLSPSFAGPWLALMGAANIVGSLAVGLALRRWDPAWLLVGLYLWRATGIALLLALPATPLVLLGFALVMGVSYIAVLPPTSQLIARHFGAQRLGTLFGIVMVLHQGGGFAGVWLGGWLAERSGNDQLFWSLDIVLALLAVALVWPRRRSTHPQPALAPRGAAA
jgi:predicted MFS family arabinose efflux permease